MRVIYVGNHGSGHGDDEGAIAHALAVLGHEIHLVAERHGKQCLRLPGQLLLFHKWFDPHTLAALENRRHDLRRVFWWFDLVDHPDPTLRARCQARARWMRDVTPRVDLGFLSDGDWQARDRTGRLVWLTQGADERVAGFGEPPRGGPEHPILFAGIRHGGQGRQSFVDEMKERYGDRFRHVERGVYRRDLANLIAASQIVVAPDAPVTDLYWSCRAYTMLGSGAFLLHPYCRRLTGHYEHGKEIVYYRSREELHEQIAYYLERPALRREIAEAGLARTLREHLYRHRVEQLLQVVKERLP